MKRWVEIKRYDDNHVEFDYEAIAKKFNIHPLTARLIINRHVTDFDDYLGDGTLNMAIQMKDVTKGASIIKNKITAGEKIRVIGDYDIDGVNASYILKKGLERCGASVSVAIPDRIIDGYGINRNLIQDAYNAGIHTIITCDNGISAIEEINYGKSLGMTIIVTDHHEIPYREENGTRTYLSSNADAIINPHQKDCKYPFKGICGAVVAWKFIQMLYRMFQIPASEADVFIENAAFATIGDVMDLCGENRAIVKRGLELLSNSKNMGIRALIEESGLSGKKLTAYHVGFVLGPCINASGRLDTALHAFNLLCSTDMDEARELANKLVQMNLERRALTEAAIAEATELVEKTNDRVLVIYLPGCHESIAGIVAGKIRERFYKPVFVLTDGENCVKGSGRSIETYSMFEEMNKVADVFMKFGGHPMAAGLSLERDRVDEFRKRINECCTLTDDDLREKVRIDAIVPLECVSEYMMEQISLLAPFGKGNAKPVFADRNLRIDKIRFIGKDESTVKLSLRTYSGYKIEGLIFHGAEPFISYLRSKYQDKAVEDALAGKLNPIRITITYDMSINEYKGNKVMQVIINEYF